ncbi:MAG: zinc ribbon domain-containing protein [bacterium]|nr:zinc ribbon domain-containing protein [bacterium]
MPTYEYACETCGRFEHLQNMSDPALDRCPRCQGPVKRMIPRQVTVIFRGPGFHVNDYRKGSSPPEPAKKEEKTATESAAASE